MRSRVVWLRKVRAEAADGKQTQIPCSLLEGREQVGCQESVLRLKYQNEKVEQFKGGDSVTRGCEAPLTHASPLGEIFDLCWITLGLGHEGESDTEGEGDTGRPAAFAVVSLHMKRQKFTLFHRFCLDFKGLCLFQPFGKTLEFLRLTAEVKNPQKQNGMTLVSSRRWKR